MALHAATIRISSPTEPIVPGRGFYQLEEDALYVQIGPWTGERRFFSWLESDPVRLDFDRYGRLVFIEVTQPRRQWTVDESCRKPGVAEMADLRWLDFRQQIDPPVLICNKRKTCLQLRFGEVNPARDYYLADHVILQTDSDNRPAALWIDDIIDDLAGQELSAFRKAMS